MRLWNPEQMIPKLKLREGDEYKICEQFFKKISCIEKNTSYKPDLSRDVTLASNYEAEPLNLYEFCNRESCVGSIQCTRLRQQSLDLLEYIRTQTFLVEELINKYHKEENERKKVCISGLVRIKTENIKLAQEARMKIILMCEQTQEAGRYLEEMIKLIKKKKEE